MNILIVNKNKTTANKIHNHFKMLNESIVCITCMSIREAKYIVNNNSHFNLLVLDTIYSDVKGYELIEYVRNIYSIQTMLLCNELRNIKCIHLYAYSDVYTVDFFLSGYIDQILKTIIQCTLEEKSYMEMHFNKKNF